MSFPAAEVKELTEKESAQALQWMRRGLFSVEQASFAPAAPVLWLAQGTSSVMRAGDVSPGLQ